MGAEVLVKGDYRRRSRPFKGLVLPLIFLSHERFDLGMR